MPDSLLTSTSPCIIFKLDIEKNAVEGELIQKVLV